MNEAELLQQNDEMRRNQYLALNGGIAAIVAALSMVVIKSIAYVFSGSSSILASLIDSVTDSAISIITVFSIRYSMKPADEDHRHGHGKIEGVSALFQGAMLSGGALFLTFD